MKKYTMNNLAKVLADMRKDGVDIEKVVNTVLKREPLDIELEKLSKEKGGEQNDR